MTAAQLRMKWERVNIILAAGIAIEETASDATRVQKEQLFSGVLSNGEPIVPPYTARTVAIKSGKGQATDRVTLRDTGSYYTGILIDVRGDKFAIESADEKAGALEVKYGRNILGLGTEARIEYIRTLKPEFIKQIRAYLK